MSDPPEMYFGMSEIQIELFSSTHLLINHLKTQRDNATFFHIIYFTQ